jgi:hypothetical protein
LSEWVNAGRGVAWRFHSTHVRLVNPERPNQTLSINSAYESVMTADSETRIWRRSSWLWRWLLSIAVAYASAGLGFLFPKQVWRIFQSLVWLARGSSAHWPSHITVDNRAAAAFVSFVLAGFSA